MKGGHTALYSVIKDIMQEYVSLMYSYTQYIVFLHIKIIPLVGFLVGFLENGQKKPSFLTAKMGTKKPRKPLKQRPSEFMELIARFELATSSLPTIFNSVFHFVSFCLLSARIVLFQCFLGLSFRLVLSRVISIFGGVFGGVVGFWWGFGINAH